MAFIDGTVVNIALPALQATMGATISDVQWVVEAYVLFLAALMLTGGALGDRFGRKRIFVIGVVAFIQLQGFSATQAGAAMIPTVLLLFLLSRWAGGLADRIGAKTLLIVGPVIASAGFALFLVPGSHAGYWTGFFPAFVTLGFGMALTVAPLTTTVMSSVSREHSGVASGMNNAISEGAGLLAVAVFGLAMSHAFHGQLERGMADAHVPAPVREEIRNQEAKLAAIEIPSQVNAKEREAVAHAIGESFIAGFRLVMVLGAVLALLSAVFAWLTLNHRHPRAGE